MSDITRFRGEIQFQHTAARRRLERLAEGDTVLDWFQHTAARRRLADSINRFIILIPFQHTAARRRLVVVFKNLLSDFMRFNTQPPEGGWVIIWLRIGLLRRFNTQPPEGGWI